MARKRKITDSMLDFGLMGVGALAAGKVRSLVPVDNSVVKNGAPIVAGYILSGQKNQMLSSVGKGMAGAAIANLITGFVPSLGAATDFSPAYNAVLNGMEDSPGSYSSPLAGGGMSDENYRES